MHSTNAYPRRTAGGRPRRLHALIAFAGVLLATLVAASAADAKPKPAKPLPVEVMTRNLFLGADLGPAIAAADPAGLVAGSGAILREVTETDFERRAVALGREIRRQGPDFVGLQEVALWREGPPDQSAFAGVFTAEDVRQDFLAMLLAEVNKGKLKYRRAVVQREFDFESPADEDGDPGTGSPTLFGADLNGRLTMRDVILVRRDPRLRVRRPHGDHFETQLVLGVAGGEVRVTRGWTALDAAVTRGKGKRRVVRRFRLVNTHLEAFDDRTEVPSIRAQQAAELIAPGGPASRGRVVLLGDLNSDVPGLVAGDEQAFQVLLDGGFVRRSTTDPPSCCVSDLFGAAASEFDHVVDHVLTNKPAKVKLVRSAVTGLAQVGGIYPSDHAGVVSRLLLRR